MRPRDLPLLVDLWVAAWRQTMPEIDFEARRDWIGTVLRDHAAATVVADWRGRPAGFSTCEGTTLHHSPSRRRPVGVGSQGAFSIA